MTLELAAAAGYNGWFTSDDDDSQSGVGHAIDYHVAGILFWEASAAVSVAGASIVGASFRGAVDGSIGAQPITAGTANAEKTLTGLDAFVDLMFLGETRQGFVYRLLSGLRLGFQHAEFRGPASAVERTAFLDAGGGLTFFDPGDVFGVKARFDDWHLALLRAGGAEGRVLRVGVYWSELEKPHEAFANPLGNSFEDNLVVETRIFGRGVFLSTSGTRIHFLLRLGVVDFEPQSGTDVVGLFAGERGYAGLGNLIWRPRIGLGRSLAIVPKIGLMFRADFLDSPTQPFDANDSELSMDIQADIGLGFSWRFGAE